LGLVNRVVPGDAVVEGALDLAAQIAANAPLAVRSSRAMVREAIDLTEADAWRRNRELQREVFAHPDAIEGARAFAEKRPPTWQSS
jgi:enoyl-CoA hydratase/carnithine racemase